MFYIFTCANSAYFIHLQGMLYSLKGYLNRDYKVIIYNIGLYDRQISILEKQFNFLNLEVKKLNLNDSNLGSYKFKAQIWQEMKELKNCYLIWLDAKSHLKVMLSDLENTFYLEPECIVIADMLVGFIESDYTHPECSTIMGFPEGHPILDKYQWQSGQYCIDLYNGVAQKFVKDMAFYGKINNCIAPNGSVKSMEKGKNTHRQDQSIFSILMNKYDQIAFLPQAFTFHNTIHQI